MRSETEDLQDLTDTALQQVQSMYSQAEQLFAEFSTKGKLFLQNSSTVRCQERHLLTGPVLQPVTVECSYRRTSVCVAGFTCEKFGSSYLVEVTAA